MSNDRCEGERVVDQRQSPAAAPARGERRVERAVNEIPGESVSNFVERTTTPVSVNGVAGERGAQSYGIYQPRDNVPAGSGTVTFRENTLANFTWSLREADATGNTQERIDKARNALLVVNDPEGRRPSVAFDDGPGKSGLRAKVGNQPVTDDPRKVAEALRTAGVTFTPSDASSRSLPTVAELHRAAAATYCPTR